jgi:hypothetical protein
MNKNELKYFFIKDFLNDSDVHNRVCSDILLFEDSPAAIIEEDGTTHFHPTKKNHIRNNCLDETVIDKMLSPSIRTIKNIIRPLVIENGLAKPMIRGLQNFSNPDSIRWHKDVVPEDMYIHSSKRFVTFFVVSESQIYSDFMVSLNPTSVELWNIGFKLELETNMLIGHNQFLGHEYNKLRDSKINIFSFLWYDTV